MRFHEMMPHSSKNLDDILASYKQFKSYSLFPAAVIEDGAEIEPVFEPGITKWHLILNDLKRLEGNEKGQSRKNRTLSSEVAPRISDSNLILDALKEFVGIWRHFPT